MTGKEIVGIGMAVFLFLSVAGGFIIIKKPFSSKNTANVVQAQPVMVARNNSPHTISQKDSPFETLAATKPGMTPTTTNQHAFAVPPVPNARYNASPVAGVPNNPVLVIFVKSIFFGKGGPNVAILSNGQDEISVMEGSSSRWGYISAITRDGVTLDGELVSLKESDSSSNPSPANPAITPMAYHLPTGGK